MFSFNEYTLSEKLIEFSFKCLVVPNFDLSQTLMAAIFCLHAVYLFKSGSFQPYFGSGSFRS